MSSKFSRGAAFHEAGHTVVAWSYGLTVKSVRVNEDESGKTDAPGADRLAMIDHIAVCQAGCASEKVFDCWSTAPRASDDDNNQIRVILLGNDVPDAEHPVWVKQADERASVRLQNHKDRVLRLVNRLVEGGYVDGDEFLQLMS